MPGSLTREAVERAFAALDRLLPREAQLIVGGGTAMLLAYRISVATADVDAYPAGVTVEELDPLVKKVAKELGLAPDWLNPYYATFAHVLPADYPTRLVEVFRGKRLWVRALGLEDLLVMKCFAGRAKDRGHARVLLRRGPDLSIVNRRLDELCDKRVKGALEAADFLDDLLSEES
jgi:predicted nucleotidyltransferase